MRLRKNAKGFALVGIIMALAIIPPTILLSMRASDAVGKAVQYYRSNQTHQNMSVVRDFLISRASNPDGDGYYELLKEDAGNAVPASLPVNTADNYGTSYKYCTWDIGSVNANGTYSQNESAPPASGTIGRLISAGKDKSFQTTCTDSSSKGDDIVVDISDESVRYTNAGIGGWVDEGNSVKLLSLTDNVGLGVDNASHRLELAAGTTPGEGIALGDVGIFRSGSGSLGVTGDLQLGGQTVIDAARNVSANNLTVAGGSLFLTNGTSNTVVWNGSGAGSPTTTIRSSGTKMVLAPTLSVSSTDYAFGVEPNYLWSSVPTSSQGFRWYGGTAVAGQLGGDGTLRTVSWQPYGSASNDLFVDVESGTRVLRTRTALGNITTTGIHTGQGTFESGVNINGGALQVSSVTVIGSDRSLQNISSVSSSLNPTTTNTIDLGSSSLNQYRNVYAQNFYQNGSSLVSAEDISGTAGAIARFTGPNSLGNSAIVDTGGLIGINETTPLETLDVKGRIRIQQMTAPATPTDRLYNVGGNLYWSGNAVWASGKVTAGTGISISGTTITNTGVTSLAGTANQVNVSGSTGAVTLSLPQNIHTGATPTFAGMTLNGNLVLGTNTLTTTNTTVVTNLNADLFEGQHGAFYQNASNINSGTIGITYLPTITTAKGGTGLTAAGTAGNLLKSDGTNWTSWTPNYLTGETDTLAAVTGRGNSTATGISLTENGNLSSSYGLYLKRNTDVSPQGYLIQAQNAAGSANLFAVDASGNVTANQFNGSGAGLTSNTVPITSLVAGDYSGKITSGTYSINISGNSATVTNGVYTTGSYADPAWITSLSKSKVGLGNVENTALSTWAGSTNITTLGTITTGTWNGTVIAVNKGGTGLTSYTVGDLIYASGVTTLSKLGDVSTGNVLLSGGSGVAPSWGKVGLTSHVTGILGIGNGGTGVSTTPSNGKLLIGNGAGYTLSTLTAGSNVTITNDVGSITISAAATPGAVNHSDLGGLNNDDHLQYALLAGRSGGQNLIGGTTANDTLVIQGNSALSGNTGSSTGIQLRVGNSGAINALTILNNGSISTYGAVAIGGNADVNGIVTANQFNGSGAGLTSNTVPIASLVAGDYSGKITSGTYSINISGNSATVTNGVYTTGSYADPAWITSLSKSKVGLGNVENTALSTWAGSTNITTLGTITTGTWNGTAIAVNKGGTGLTATPTNGQLLIGNGTGYSLAGLTAGTAIGISNGAGTITITNNGVTSLTGTANQVNVSGSTGAVTLSLPQNIHTGATPTFAGMTLNGNLVLGTNTLTTTNTTVVTNLNADRIDGYHAGNGASNVLVLDASGLVPVADLPTITTAKGGTGLTAAGTAGNLLKSDGTNWTSWTPNYLTGEADTLATVTGRGNSTAAGISLTENGNLTASYALNLKRNTDTSPLGYLIQAQNAAGSANLFAVDASGNVTANQFNGSGAGLTSNTVPIASLVAGDYSGKITSGTYSINISGNSATVTNGVYTTGSYADPAWITSLSKSKVGLGNVENTALSTWAGSTNITTLGTITTGTWNGTAIAVNKGGTGLIATPTNGQLLIGNGTGYSLAGLTAGTAIGISNGAGTITITNNGVTSFNTRTGAVTLSSADVTGALGYTPWHAGNDGAGSGLDADLLDGQSGSYYQNASNITAGTLAVARGGTGLSTTPTNGQLLIGNGTGYALNNLTAGSGISITNGAGTITISNTGVLSINGTANQVYASASTGAITLSLPQDIHTAATPTFAGMTLNGNLSIAAGDGRGMLFWSSDCYKMYMSSAANVTDGGRLDSFSDYNMYFKISNSGGANRGFVFMAGDTGRTPVAQIDGAGNFYLTGNIIGSGSSSAFGSLTVYGGKGGWSGISFRDMTGTLAGTLMASASDGTFGWFNKADTAWNFRVDGSGNLIIPGTITASGYNAGNWDTAYAHSQDVTGNVHGATSANNANMIVRRDGTGGFAAGAVTTTSVTNPVYAP